MREVPAVAIDVPHGRPNPKDYAAFVNPDVKAWAKLGYDEDAFFVELQTVEKDIRAEGKAVPDAPCDDSCLEFFFCPMQGDKRYFNIEFNLNGLLFLGFGENVETLFRLVPEEENLFEPEPRKTADGWNIRYRVPFAFVRRFFPGFKPESGYAFRGNFYKCGDFTKIPHYYAWSEITREKLTFHAPECFGELILE